ncbi:uncharacterized protein EV154DRAFT_486107 [Mucor mucedo]|uniref:uncharacterized protein n=1 Tax=Mucor mucedo TaxID=29922 RepID=UPI00221ED258|nr:uncharacterized protein EV154DRAFT_486107 [Mucor mucedo]KAI7879225.1 hypothetical protein EV154DRAFT_486107 [Mucor mucedo]
MKVTRHNERCTNRSITLCTDGESTEEKKAKQNQLVTIQANFGGKNHNKFESNKKSAIGYIVQKISEIKNTQGIMSSHPTGQTAFPRSIRDSQKSKKIWGPGKGWIAMKRRALYEDEGYISHNEVPQLALLRTTISPEYCATRYAQFKDECYCYCYWHLIMVFLYGIITSEYYLDKSTHNRHQPVCY